MIKAVIFDMDGVLINSEPAYFEVEKKLFKRLGLKISHQQHQTFVGMTMPTIWEIIKEKNELNYSIDELVEMHKEGIFNYFIKAESLVTIPGIMLLLNKLEKSNKIITVASSTNRELVKIILEKMNILDRFKFYTGGNEVNKGKPAPDVFLLASQKIGIAPENCVVIEDSENGVIAAKKAGTKVIGFINPDSGQQDLSRADITIKEFSEINIEMLDKIIRLDSEDFCKTETYR